jgi:hypothetical protein
MHPTLAAVRGAVFRLDFNPVRVYPFKRVYKVNDIETPYVKFHIPV